MANTTFQGIDIRQTGDRLLFRVLELDGTGVALGTGTSNLKLYELQSDGSLKSYDWNDNTFKTTALTTENQAMTARTGNNGTTTTGLWTFALTTLTGFTAGSLYFASVHNTGASPQDQSTQFQFGVTTGSLTPFTDVGTALFAKALSAKYGSYTFEQAMDLLVTMRAGLTSGLVAGVGSLSQKAPDGTAGTFTATIDANGNVTAISFTP